MDNGESPFQAAVSEALRLAAECTFLSPFEQALQHMGQCDEHNILYVIINPSKPNGCPHCEGRITDNGDGTVTYNVNGLLQGQDPGVSEEGSGSG
jgi:hypothetical protein